MQKTDWLIFLWIVCIVILLRLPSVLEPLDNDSGAIAYHARLISRGEPLYGSHHTGHHMPGAYYTYVLSFLLFGDTAMAPKWLLIPWTMLTAWILYWIGTRFSNRVAGLLGALFFSVLSAHMHLKGMTAEPELFANLPITAAVWLALTFIQEPKRVRAWFWVGLLGGIAMLYKIVYIAPLGVAVVLIGAAAVWQSGDMVRWRKAFGQIIWLVGGFVLPVGLAAVYFVSQGLLGRFLLVFRLGFTYVREINTIIDVQVPLFVLFPLLFMAFNNTVVVVLATGNVLRQTRQMRSEDHSKRVLAAGLVAWIGLSVLQAGVARIGFAHYVLLVVPPASLLTGLEIDSLRMAVSNGKTARWGNWLAIGLVSAVLVNSGLVNGAVYRDYVSYISGDITYKEYLKGHFGTGVIHLQMSEIADYVRRHTEPDDSIYYWGNDVQLYYLADRRCASENIWPYYAGAYHPVREIFGPQTKYIILGDPGLYQDWKDEIANLIEDYVLENTIEGHQIYRFEGK